MLKPRGKFLSSEEGTPANGQHRRPCSDCPLRRDAIRGWLGASPNDPIELASAEEWLQMLQGETRMHCHTKIGAQCAGAAIFRANVLKLPRDRAQLVLPANARDVFGSSEEFRKHHTW